MIKRILRTPFYLVGVLPFRSGLSSSYDVDVTQSEEKKSEEKSGWDRLYHMYSLDEFGSMSPELTSAMQGCYLGLFVGAIYGGLIFSRTAYLDFMERNEASAFQSHLDAKRKLQDAVTMGFAKGAFKWGWRVALFSGSFVLISTSVATYRGTSGALEYFITGGVTGSMARIHVGLRGMLVGGILGSMLGGFAGGLTTGILKVAGMTMDDVRYWQYKWKEDRKDLWRQTFKAQDKDMLLEQHDMKVGPKGKSLEAIDSSDVSDAKST